MVSRDLWGGVWEKEDKTHREGYGFRRRGQTQDMRVRHPQPPKPNVPSIHLGSLTSIGCAIYYWLGRGAKAPVDLVSLFDLRLAADSSL